MGQIVLPTVAEHDYVNNQAVTQEAIQLWQATQPLLQVEQEEVSPLWSPGKKNTYYYGANWRGTCIIAARDRHGNGPEYARKINAVLNLLALGDNWAEWPLNLRTFDTTKTVIPNATNTFTFQGDDGMITLRYSGTAELEVGDWIRWDGRQYLVAIKTDAHNVALLGSELPAKTGNAYPAITASKTMRCRIETVAGSGHQQDGFLGPWRVRYSEYVA